MESIQLSTVAELVTALILESAGDLTVTVSVDVDGHLLTAADIGVVDDRLVIYLHG